MANQNVTTIVWQKPAAFVKTPVDEEARVIIVMSRNGFAHGLWSREDMREHFIAWAEMPEPPSWFRGSPDA